MANTQFPFLLNLNNYSECIRWDINDFITPAVRRNRKFQLIKSPIVVTYEDLESTGRWASMMKEIKKHRKFFHTMKFTMLLVNALVSLHLLN